ncbi:histone-lysine N-methyltransferase SMYD3-like [Diadema setosum]|uniref:histone-lysine N-methyltransferase SMYD3-like n=1 Tax=Diadema setosum TaxID=31175 RepID=UPI003B3A0018
MAVACVETDGKGRGLVVKSSVCRGKLLLSEDPFVYVLSRKKRGIFCDFCLLESSSLQRCSSCKFVRYCCRSCQKEDWSRIHKAECRSLKSVSPKTPPELARLLAHIIWKGKGEHPCSDSKDQNGFPTSVDQLESHHSKLGTSRQEHFASVLCVLQQYVGQENLPDPSRLLQLFAAAVCNSFSVCDTDLNSCGVGIYLRSSLLNHSCDPNCVAVFSGITLQVRAIRDLKEGEECTISYVDCLLPRVERHAELLERYHFTCHCPKCEDQDDPEANNSKQSVKELKESFRKVEEAKRLHHHYLLVKLRDAALDVCIEAQLWKEAASYGLQNVESYRYHYGNHHPSLGVHLVKVGKLLLYLEQIAEAAKYLTQGMAVLEVTHGNKHPLMGTVKDLLGNCR